MGLFSSNSNEIKVESEIKANQNAYECLRVWMLQDRPVVYGEKLKFSEDPRVWGSILADVTALVSTHNNDGNEKARKEDIEKIRDFFNYIIDGWVK
tara:strand:+ start:642 stop:929 length:288 start_codon:yes stop_codon:yes gene_type:complete